MHSGDATLRASKELIKEINTLRTQLKRLSATIESEAESGVSGALNAAESKSKEAIDAAIAAAQNFIDQYANGARDTAEHLLRNASELRDTASASLVERVRTNPLSTVATIAGVGFLAGFLLRRR